MPFLYGSYGGNGVWQVATNVHVYLNHDERASRTQKGTKLISKLEFRAERLLLRDYVHSALELNQRRG